MTFKRCKNCKNRVLGCHSSCPIYLEEKKKYDELAEKIRAEKMIQNDQYYSYGKRRRR